MQFSRNKDVCFCSSMSQVSYSPSFPLNSSTEDVSSKYYQEIGADMVNNQLIIRLEKDKNRLKRKHKEWTIPCDCVEIQRPTNKTGPKIINGDYDDRIVFRVHEKENFIKKPQTIAYKIGSCKDDKDSHRCKTITVYPQFTSGTQEVYSDHIAEGNENIFLLRIKKKAKHSEQKNRNVELELRTPKPPTLPPSPAPVSTLAVVSPQIIADLDAKDIEEPDRVEEITEQPVKVAKNKKNKNRK